MADASRIRIIRVLTPGPPGPAGPPNSYLAPGGTLAIPLDDKLDEVVAVTGWMTTPYDSAADHTSWLLNVIDKVHSQLGGAAVGILMPHPIYNVSDTITIPYDNIHLIGRGSGNKRGNITVSRQSAATRIVASATFPTTAGKAVLEWQPVDGATWPVVGGGAEGLMIDAGDRPARGLALLSMHSGYFQDLQIYGGTEVSVLLSPSARTIVQGDYASQRHVFDNCTIHSVGLTSSTAYALRMTGTANGNANLNQFRLCHFVSQANSAVRWEDSDYNCFIQCIMGSEHPNAVANLYYGLEFTSQKEFANGCGRYSTLHNCLITTPGIIFRAGNVNGQEAAHDVTIFENSFDTGGGLITVETPTNGAFRPHAILHNREGVAVYGFGRQGNIYYSMAGIAAVQYRELFREAAATPEMVNVYCFADPADLDNRAIRARFSDGRIRVVAPHANLFAQAISSANWTNNAGTSTGTLTNAPAAGNPTKWLKIDDAGTARYIPAW